MINTIFLIAIISLVETIQLVIMLASVLALIPYNPTAFVADLYPYFQWDVHPEHEMLIYRIAVISAIVVMAGLISMLKNRLEDQELRATLCMWAYVMGGVLAVQIFFVFKLFVWQSADTSSMGWAKPWLMGSMITALLLRIFFKEVKNYLYPFFRNLGSMLQPRATLIIDCLAVFLICSTIYIVDMPKTLALIFTSDQFYHLDGFVVASAWAASKNLTLNVDVISQYGVMLPKLLAALGNISYAQTAIFLMTVTILYWLLFYTLLRVTLKHAGVCLWGLILAIKWQMFHWGVWPIIWRFGTPTVVRHVFDIPVLMLLYMHQQTKQSRWLWLSCVLSGIACSYMIDTGVYLAAAVSLYVGFQGQWSMRALMVKGIQIAMIPITALVMLWLIMGPVIFHAIFWQNMFEHANLFLSGFGSLPMTDALTQNQFYCFIKGLLIPVVYVGSGLWFLQCWIDDKKNTRVLWLLAICVYGLGLYHYYINRSAFTSFDVVCVPLVIILTYGASRLLIHLRPQYQRLVLVGGVCTVTIGLLTNPLFLIYPNIFHANAVELKQAQASYDQWYLVKDDGALINQYTLVDERVAMISSFETALLMEAKRAPYFYYTPMIESSPWPSETFRGTYLHQQSRMNKTLTALRTHPPRTIVVETKLIDSNLAEGFMKEHLTLKKLIDVVKESYKPIVRGKFITVYQR